MLEVALLVSCLLNLILFVFLLALAFANQRYGKVLKTEAEISQGFILKNQQLEQQLNDVTEDRDRLRARYSN